jgi:hypothetical protein
MPLLGNLNWPGEQFQNSVTTKVINNEDKIKVGPTEEHYNIQRKKHN